MKPTTAFHHLTSQEQAETIQAYTTDLVSMKKLAAKYNVSRQAIYKTLVKAGVNTHKGIGGASQVSFSCPVCGEAAVKSRAYIRKTKHTFCSQKCYLAWLQHGNGNPLLIHRHSARIARAKVQKLFNLLPGHIVHHEDRSQFNNDPSNLKVFTNQGDHVRYHRGFIVPILWEGKTHF